MHLWFSKGNPLSAPRGLLRVISFAAVCLLSAAGALAYVWHVRERTFSRQMRLGKVAAMQQDQIAELRRRPHLLFRSTAEDPSYGMLSVVSLDAPNGPRYVTGVHCERVYGSVDTGVCLQASRGVFTSYQAVSFDQNFTPLYAFDLAGTPSRVRVSRNGRLAATTVFVKGDSYNSGGFSTRTSLFDLSTGKVTGNLEEFAVSKNGRPFRKIDFNFWGVTFAPDGERFFATLGSGGAVYLVEGQTSARTMCAIREGVECPSLSPDGRRLAFKSRTTENGYSKWSLHILDLSTGAETSIKETRNVDDQAEWLDSEYVLYCIPQNVPGRAASDIWIARADGSEQPRIFVTDASSPSVIRP